MQDYFIRKSEIKKLLDFLEFRYDVYVINRNAEHLFWKRFVPGSVKDVIINEYRPAEPLKGFIFKSKERVTGSPADTRQKKRPTALIGAKACDLRSLKILDHVFMEGDREDPFYRAQRENTLILSADCTSFKDVCFCLAVGVEPFPRENFDVNITDMENGYILTVGSEKGRHLIEQSKLAVKEATERQQEKRKKDRERFLKLLEASINQMRLPAQSSLGNSVRAHYKSNVWETFAEQCVECGGCNTICPTCHCFLLVDQTSKDAHQRLKIWDSCLLKRFAQVAGGANPRRHLYERLRNRFVKKFDFFPQVLSVYACTGCGRCIETCPGDIDIREVLKELAKQ